MTQINRLTLLTVLMLVLNLALCGVMFGVWQEVDGLGRQLEQLGKNIQRLEAIPSSPPT
jgi:cell division protein FtsX